MRYTPLDVRHQEFPGRLGGYRRAEVRGFLSEVADDLEEGAQWRARLQDRVTELEARLEEYTRTEQDLRRAVVSAERIGAEVREAAKREAELITREAEAYKEQVAQAANTRSGSLETRHEARISELESLHRARSTELESAHLARSTQLEAGFRARFSDLEAQYQRRHRELEQSLAARTGHLEATFSQRHAELSTLLTQTREEHAQFVTQYRAVVGSFAELASRHLLPEALPLPTQAPAVTLQQGEPPQHADAPMPGEAPGVSGVTPQFTPADQTDGAADPVHSAPDSMPDSVTGTAVVQAAPAQSGDASGDGPLEGNRSGEPGRIEEQQFV
jgi:cell division initiation protein